LKNRKCSVLQSGSKFKPNTRISNYVRKYGFRTKGSLTVKGDERLLLPQILSSMWFKTHGGVAAVAGIGWFCGDPWVFALTSQVERISILQLKPLVPEWWLSLTSMQSS